MIRALADSIPPFAQTLHICGQGLRRTRTRVLQINTGKLCNLTCVHCHVNAGPRRKEVMTEATAGRILDWLAGTDIPVVDITGGAPEMVPPFRRLVEGARELGRHVMDRCNLTIFYEPGFEWVPEFLAEHRVEVVASMPCYSPENVNEQRGDGVFDASIRGLQDLNALGYGSDPALPLHLVYNPNGAFLPGPQDELEADYKRELHEHFGITFNKLYTITNMPVSRFVAYLKREGEYEAYMRLLVEAFNPGTVEGLMCRDTLNIGWQGEVYDCDFNGMLDLQWAEGEHRLHLWDLDPAALEGRAIATGNHCYGCTAGAGSSCGGAVA